MPNLITIDNAGPLIAATNYWDSPLAARGLLWASCNAGAIRILLPPIAEPSIPDILAASECILSRGPWPAQQRKDAIELMWEDGSEAPFALHLSPESFDLLPAEPEPGREWAITTWRHRDGRPELATSHRCRYRRVPRLPWLKPWRAR